MNKYEWIINGSAARRYTRSALRTFITIWFSGGGHIFGSYQYIIASNNQTILANIIYGETSGSRMEME